MKKIYLIIILLYSQLANANVPDSIPNSGFEQWFTTTWFDFPAGWMTNNSQLLAAVVVKDSVSHSGNLALRLTNMGSIRPHAWCNFPVTSHPLNLGGYLGNFIFNNDSGEIVVRIFYNQQMVDSGQLIVYNSINPNWNTFVVPISQNSLMADSCEISFLGGNVYQSDLVYDDLEFDFSTQTTEIKKTPFTIYPIPCNNQVTMQTQVDFYPDEIYAINMTGQLHLFRNLVDELKQEDYIYYLTGNRKVVFDTSLMKNGEWIIVAKKKDEVYTIKLIKE